MVLSSFFVCFGQMLWKLSSEGGYLPLFGGFVLYGIGALLMLIAYKFGSLSVLQPILSINYVLSLLIGYYYFEETLEWFNVLGVFIILLGVGFIASSD